MAHPSRSSRIAVRFVPAPIVSSVLLLLLAGCAHTWHSGEAPPVPMEAVDPREWVVGRSYQRSAQYAPQLLQASVAIRTMRTIMSGPHSSSSTGPTSWSDEGRRQQGESQQDFGEAGQLHVLQGSRR
jgi:hypothetical protein